MNQGGRDRMRRVKVVLISVFLVAGAACAGTIGKSIDGGASIELFAKSTLIRLFRGVNGVGSDIDWLRLNVDGKNIGDIYGGMPGESARSGFRTEFLKSISKGYRESNPGAVKLDNMLNGAQYSVVFKNGPFAKVVGRNGNRAVVSIVTSDKGRLLLSQISIIKLDQ
jgi:hypothetical protein